MDTYTHSYNTERRLPESSVGKNLRNSGFTLQKCDASSATPAARLNKSGTPSTFISAWGEDQLESVGSQLKLVLNIIIMLQLSVRLSTAFVNLTHGGQRVAYSQLCQNPLSI